MNLLGLHHITAIASDPKSNVDFYSRVLGLELLRPNICVPMQDNTWPILQQDAAKFARADAQSGHEVKVMTPGASCSL